MGRGLRLAYTVLLGFFFGAFILLALRGAVEVHKNLEYLYRLAREGNCGKLGWKTYYILVNRLPAALLPIMVLAQRPGLQTDRRFAYLVALAGLVIPLAGIIVGGMGIHSLSYAVVGYLIASRARGMPAWLATAYVYAAVSFVSDFYEWPIMFFDNKLFVLMNRTWFYTVFLFYMAVWHRMRPTRRGLILLALATVYPVFHIQVMNRQALGPIPWEIQTISTALARILWALALHQTRMEPRAPHRWLLA